MSAYMTKSWSWEKFGFSVLGGAIGGAISGGAVVLTTEAVVNAVATGMMYAMVPSYTIPVGDWSFSISPSIAFGNASGIGVSVGVGYNDGKWGFSAGVGIMRYGNYHGFGNNGLEIRKSILASWDDGKMGLSLGTNFWGGDFKQQTGMIGFRHGDFSVMYENDGSPFDKVGKGYLGDGHDRWRTAAMRFGIGDFSAGFNLFTGERYSDSYESKGNSKGTWDDIMMTTYNRSEPYNKEGIRYNFGLVEEKGTRYRLGAAYVGWGNYRVGINSDRHVRHPIQNILAHDRLSPQPGFEVLSRGLLPYFQYHTRNRFTSW